MKAIPDTNNQYFAEENGSVYSMKYKDLRKLKMSIDKSGYGFYTLRINGKYKGVKAHRLIAKTFIDNNENKEQVNHINGIKTDNRVENLEWCTAKENTRHAIKCGLHIPNGINGTSTTRGGKALFTIEEASDLIEMKEAIKLTIKEISIIANCSYHAISNIINNKNSHFKGGVYVSNNS